MLRKIPLTLAIVILFAVTTQAKQYTMCAKTYTEAKLELASMIHSSIDAVQSKSIKSQRSNGAESVSSTIEQTNSVESHLDLVKMTLYKEGKKKCAKIESKEQVAHTKALLGKTKQFSVQNLPKANKKKVATLEKWLAVIRTTEQMVNVFGESVSTKDKATLITQYKMFSDLHTETLLQIDSLVFKGCANDKEKALQALDQTIFTHSKHKKKGFFDTMTSWISSDDEVLQVMLFESYISIRKKRSKTCAYVVKAELLLATEKMAYKLEGFKIARLPQEPKEKLKQIDSWIKHINVTYSLMQVFSKEFTREQLKSVTAKKSLLVEERKKIIPQSMVFHVLGTTNAEIVINGKEIKANKRLFFPAGTYNYVVSAKGYCPLKGSIELEALEDEVISINLDGQQYPTVLFVSDIDFTAMVDGISIQPNVRKTIERCSQEVPYLVKVNTQSYQGSLDLDPGEVITKNFSFLSIAEKEVFSDAKTQHFSVKNDEKISDTLSTRDSKKLHFNVINSPKSGTLKLDKSGHFVYTPELDFIGKVSFDYIIINGDEKSSTKVAVIEVTGIKKAVVVKPVPIPVSVVAKKEPEKKSVKEVAPKKESKTEKPAKVDEVKLEAFLNAKLKENDIATLKQAQKRFPEAFDRWMKKTRGQ